MTMIGGLYQAVPGRLQVAVSVRDIWSKRIKLGARNPDTNIKESETFTPY
jgi:hypothetical protein